jgi:hypothetical protein
MDIDCIICLTKTNLKLRHHLCCQCGKLVCDDCLEKPDVKKIKECPHCKYKNYNKISLTKLFKLTERENIDHGVVYNIIGCHFIDNNVRKRGTECLKMASSSSYLAKQNLNFTNGEEGAYGIRFNVSSYDTDLLCVKRERIKEFIKIHSDNLNKKMLLVCVKNLYKEDKPDDREIWKYIVEKFKEEDDFLIFKLIYDFYEMGEKINKNTKEINKELALKIEELALKNIPLAIFETGRLYMENKVFPRNYKKAHDYFILLPNDPNALFMLSYIYKNGCGIEKDLVKSFEYLAKVILNKNNGFYNFECDFFKEIDNLLQTEYDSYDFNISVDEVDDDEDFLDDED